MEPMTRKRGRPRKNPVVQTPAVPKQSKVKTTIVSQNSRKGENNVSNESKDETNVSNNSKNGNSINNNSKDDNSVSNKSSSVDSTDNEADTPVYRRRRRRKTKGRRPGRKIIEPDNDYTPRLSLRPTEYHKEYTTIEIQFIDEELTCAKCSEKVPKPQWTKHNLNKHNNMAWIEGTEQPNYENNEKLWRSILTVAHKQKRGTLICDKCNITKRSVIGFISHYKFCGLSEEEKEALMWTCPLCRGIFMPSSQDIHERMHRDAQRQEEMLKSLNLNQDLDRKRKRKAAEKAATKITEFTELIKEKVDPLTKKTSKIDINNFIEQPQLKKFIPHVWKGNWIRALAADKKAVCRQPGCTFASSTLEEICDHHSQCNFTPRTTYVCKICKFMSDSSVDLTEHVRKVHPEKIISGDESDFNTNEPSGDSEEEPPKDERRGRKPTIRKKEYDRLSKIELRADFLKKAQLYIERNINAPYLPAIRWTLDFQINNYQLILFENLQPNNFTLLGNSDFRSYLPNLEVSMRTKQAKTLPKDLKNTDPKVNNKHEWKTWKQFESAIVNNIPTFFVGGPIWAIAWLPIPIPMYSYEVNQYIAISTHPTMYNIHLVGKTYTFNNVIQIWNLGHLSEVSGCIPGTPKLAYAVAHKNGTIWCMEWCPSGTYGDNILLINSVQFENLAKRMGLLAVASSDGCVHIYSLPFPEALNFIKDENHDLPIYKTDPVMTLHANKLLHDRGKVNWQCINLSWSKLFGHNIVAAGFSNGYVALWNLSNKSPLIVSKSGLTLHMNAHQHFLAHGQAVTYVEVIPFGGNRYLATASLDRCSKMWDLENTINSVEIVKRGMAVNGAWLTHWPNIYTSYDDALGLSHTTTYMIGLREGNSKVFPLLPTNSVTYGLAASDFANSICHGTLAGELVAIFPFQMLYLKDIDKLTKKRWLVSSIEVVDFEDPSADIKVNNNNNNNNNNTKKEKKGKSDLKEHNYMPETYEECAKRFGIVFHDDLNNVKNNGMKKSDRRNPLNSDTMKFTPVEQYPFTSVNRIAWNPNSWSYLWIAAGYQNGLVRVLHLKPMSSQNHAMKLLPEYSDIIMDKAVKIEPSSPA